MKVNRETFLRALDSVSPGLSPKEILEQSASLVFLEDTVMTFNDNVYCESPSGLSGVKGAVTAKPLLDQLRKWKEDDVDIAFNDGEMVVTGKGGQKAGFRLEKEIALPVESVEKPKSWGKCNDQFAEAVGVVQQCAGSDDNEFNLTCVHIHPKWVEACDRFQLCRWEMETGLKEEVLVKQSSIKHIVQLGMTEFSVTNSWLHFRNPNGLILSCRRYLEDYPDVSSFLDVDGGVKATLPKALGEAVARAEIFSAENQDNNVVKVELTAGKLNLIGTGVNGWYRKPMKVNYSGKPMAFMVAPKLLAELVKKHEECFVSSNRLKVDAGKYAFVAHLMMPDGDVAVSSDNETAEEEAEEKPQIVNLGRKKNKKHEEEE